MYREARHTFSHCLVLCKMARTQAAASKDSFMRHCDFDS